MRERERERERGKGRGLILPCVSVCLGTSWTYPNQQQSLTAFFAFQVRGDTSKTGSGLSNRGLLGYRGLLELSGQPRQRKTDPRPLQDPLEAEAEAEGRQGSLADVVVVGTRQVPEPGDFGADSTDDDRHQIESHSSKMSLRQWIKLGRFFFRSFRSGHFFGHRSGHYIAPFKFFRSGQKN